MRARHVVGAWIGLIVLTTISAGITHARLGDPGFAVALVIATVKASLVALVFMELIEARFSTRIVLVVVALTVALLVTMVTLDPLTRHTFPAAEEQGREQEQEPAITTAR
jgi:cytochrome c oxidase subunit 4